ncbi:MAG: FAD-dependent oxidoreductase [Pseudomonadota bacterium]
MAQAIVIVGAGPAGLSAALALAAVGVPCRLLDDNAAAGGQIFRTGAQAVAYPGRDARGDRLRAAFQAHGSMIDYRPQAEIVGMEPDLSLWVHGSAGAVERLRPRAVVLATGALELWAPIPGWTLPGVYGLGGLQICSRHRASCRAGRWCWPAPARCCGWWRRSWRRAVRRSAR